MTIDCQGLWQQGCGADLHLRSFNPTPHVKSSAADLNLHAATNRQTKLNSAEAKQVEEFDMQVELSLSAACFYVASSISTA